MKTNIFFILDITTQKSVVLVHILVHIFSHTKTILIHIVSILGNTIDSAF